MFLVFNVFHLGGLLSSKAKRAKCSTHKQRVIVMLYNKVCDIVSSLSELLEIQLLTDTTILQVGFFLNLLYICRPNDLRIGLIEFNINLLIR